MRKIILVFAVVLLCVSIVQAQKENSCKGSVEGYISGLETIEKSTGVEQKLKGLSIKDIQEMRKTKDDCEVMKEINKRTMVNKNDKND